MTKYAPTYLMLLSVTAMVMFPGPVGMAIAGVICGGFLLKGVEAYLAIDKGTKAIASTSVHDPEYGIYNGYACPVWDQNRIERELGGTDFVKCFNEGCPSCFPPRGTECEVADCQRPAGIKSRSGEYLCWTCNDIRVKQDKPLRGKAKREAEARANAERMMRSIEEAKKRGDEKRRKELPEITTRSIGGRTVQIPAEVPAYAHGVLYEADLHNNWDFVIWSWVDPKSGQNMGAKQILAPQFEAEWKGDEYWYEKEQTSPMA